MENSMMQKEPSKGLVIAAFAALYIIWGSTYLAILFALRDIPPFFLAGIRFFLAGVILYTWCRIKKQPVPDFTSFSRISFSGILMLFFGTGSLVWVEQYISSGLAAIIVATVPLWFVLLDKHQWKFHFNNKFIIIGLLIGFAGVIALFTGNKDSAVFSGKMQWISFIVLMAGSILWVVGSLYAKYKPMEGSSGMKASIQMMAAGIVSLITGIISGEHNHFDWNNISLPALGGLLYLITFGSLIGFVAYAWLLSVKPPSLVGTYAYVNPVVAVFLGWLFANESISRQQIIALIIILAGVIMVNLTKEKSTKYDSKDMARKSAA